MATSLGREGLQYEAILSHSITSTSFSNPKSHPHTLNLTPSPSHPYLHPNTLTLKPSRSHPHLRASPSHPHPHPNPHPLTLTLTSPSPSHPHLHPHPSHPHLHPHTLTFTLTVQGCWAGCRREELPHLLPTASGRDAGCLW